MSWKTSGRLLSGPPSANPGRNEIGTGTGTSAGPSKLPAMFRPNLGGRTAWQREREAAARYGDGRDGGDVQGRTEWDVLRENHHFIRDDEEPSNVSWEERLARAYESKLFKEFALIDLKHYKTRRLALRWRTATEVVEGIGEDTCGSLRCKHHHPVVPSHSPSRVNFDEADDEEYDQTTHGHGQDHGHDRDRDYDEAQSPEYSRKKRKKARTRPMPPLRAFELPFAYEEAGERKEALVKVRLCGRCQRKLTWKPGKTEVESGGENGTDNLEEEREKIEPSSRTSDRKRDGGESRRPSRTSAQVDTGHTRIEDARAVKRRLSRRSLSPVRGSR